MRAKEAKKAYPVRLKKCRPHRARPFGAGLERQHGRRASPTADERLRSYEESRESYRELLVPVQKKRDLNPPMLPTPCPEPKDEFTRHTEREHKAAVLVGVG